MIDQVSKYNKRIGLEIRLLKKSLNSEAAKTLKITNEYLNCYCKYYDLSVEFVVHAINKFSERYVEDIKKYIDTRKYPYELERFKFDLSRLEYDLFLVSSILFTRHRFLIINELNNLKLKAQNALSIGVGSGVELEFMKNKVAKLTAYDLSIGDFPMRKHEGVEFIKAGFTSDSHKYDAAFTIELIEHLSEPFELIQNVYDSLIKNGVLIVTTAKNVPQFDHLYNFKSENEFEKKVEKMGFKIKYKKVILHNYRFHKIDANNVF